MSKVKGQKVERQRLLHDLEIHNQADPHISVATVTGRPIRRYSRKPTCTPSAPARSTTMMFATEPVMVRFPASVEAIASANQPECGSGKSRLKEALRQSRALRARDNDEQPDEEHEESPVDALVHFRRFDGTGDEQQRCANCRTQSQYRV
jgi:hypothetical protein